MVPKKLKEKSNYMATHYDKIDISLKEIREIRGLIEEGVGTIEEKEKAIQLAKDTSKLFTDEILKRKAHQLETKNPWKNLRKSGNPYVGKNEALELDPWIELLEEYKEKRKVKSKISSENTAIVSSLDGEDQHIYITEKGSKEKVHLIIDHRGTRELIRFDKEDQAPQELIKSVNAEIELNNGDTVQIAKSGIRFIEPKSPEPSVKVYSATKNDYFLLEIYNCGDEDLEKFTITIKWQQPDGEKERILSKFNGINDNLVMASPQPLNVLRIGEKLYARDIPTISVDGKIKGVISCHSVKSGKKVEEKFEFETPNRYK